MAITDIDRQEWTHLPVTQEFLQTLKASKQETMENWAAKAYVGNSAEDTLSANALALGGVQVLDQVIYRITLSDTSEG